MDQNKSEKIVSILLPCYAFFIIIDTSLAILFNIGTINNNIFLIYFIFYFFVSGVETSKWKFKHITQKLYIKIPTWIIIIYVIYDKIITKYLI